MANAFQAVVTAALTPMILTPEQEEAWRTDPVSASDAPAGSDPIALLDGEQDVGLPAAAASSPVRPASPVRLVRFPSGDAWNAQTR